MVILAKKKHISCFLERYISFTYVKEKKSDLMSDIAEK